MKNCETCKWWGSEVGEENRRKHACACCNEKLIRVVCDDGTAVLDHQTAEPLLPNEIGLSEVQLARVDSRAYASDCCSPFFWTGPKFGCVHHEEKS